MLKNVLGKIFGRILGNFHTIQRMLDLLLSKFFHVDVFRKGIYKGNLEEIYGMAMHHKVTIEHEYIKNFQ